MRGPYTQFSMKEVTLIHALVSQTRSDEPEIAAMIEEIKDKCAASINWDPRLRQPDVQLTPKEISDATLYGV